MFLDSGLRRGVDLIRAKALGADFVLAGQALAFGVGAGAKAGAQRAFDILMLELIRALGQMGVPEFASVGPSALAAGLSRRWRPIAACRPDALHSCKRSFGSSTN